MKEMTDGEKLAHDVADAINNMSFDSKGFCEQMSLEHRTLQQNFMRLIATYIQYVAEQPDYMFDGRNECAQKFAKEVVAQMKSGTIEDYLPFV